MILLIDTNKPKSQHETHTEKLAVKPSANSVILVRRCTCRGGGGGGEKAISQHLDMSSKTLERSNLPFYWEGFMMSVLPKIIFSGLLLFPLSVFCLFVFLF